MRASPQATSLQIPPASSSAVARSGSARATARAADRPQARWDRRTDPSLLERACARLRRRCGLGGVRQRNGCPDRREQEPGLRRRSCRTTAARDRRRRGCGLGDAQLISPTRWGRWWSERGLRELRVLAIEHWDPANVYDDPANADLYDAYLQRVGRMLKRGKGPAEIAKYLGEVRTKAFKRERERRERRELRRPRDRLVRRWKHRRSRPRDVLAASGRVEQACREREAGGRCGDSRLGQRGGESGGATAATSSAFPSGRRRSVAAATYDDRERTERAACDRKHTREHVDVILGAGHVGRRERSVQRHRRRDADRQADVEEAERRRPATAVELQRARCRATGPRAAPRQVVDAERRVRPSRAPSPTPSRRPPPRS